VTDRLALFPLGTVLFPGLVLPLHIFEERYRALIADRRESGVFGVVAIKAGWEVGGAQEIELHEVGCSAEIRQLTEHPDGRFDIVTVGRRRFRILQVHTGEAPYLLADVEWMPEAPADADPDIDKLIPGLLGAFQRYLELIRTDGHQAGEQLPDDPAVLSYLIAATLVLTTSDRQQLLACATTRDRLLAERRMLGREIALVGQVHALPVPLNELATPPSPN
jgi:Lon protease-like protein